MANKYVRIIQSTRSKKIPKPGDRIRLTTKHGDYYHKAHIEQLCENGLSVCEKPYVPFIYPSKDGISCDTSGGSWCSVNPDDLKYVGKELKQFKDWGTCGVRANGTIYFEAEVSVWEYNEPDPLYNDFSTKSWRKDYVYLLPVEQQKECGYMYYATRISWKTLDELNAYVLKYKGKLFEGNWNNQQVLWCYHHIETSVTQHEWDNLQLPQCTIYCNGELPAKYKYDDSNRAVIHYYVPKTYEPIV